MVTNRSLAKPTDKIPINLAETATNFNLHSLSKKDIRDIVLAGNSVYFIANPTGKTYPIPLLYPVPLVQHPKLHV